MDKLLNTNLIKTSIITSLYNSSKYLEPFFLNFLEITNLNQVELIIIHNDPQEAEKEIIQKYSKEVPNLIYKQVPLEGLYNSWNRAIRISNGKYIAMWSVDDRRVPDSLEKQAEILDYDSDCMIVSGNYYKVSEYGDTIGILKKDPILKRKMNGITKFNNGCFLMWRKKVHNTAGYFDEQLKIIGDHDFWIRVSLLHKVKSIDEILGYYLRNNEGISKLSIKDNNKELNVVKFRYYKYFIINPYIFFYRQYIYDDKIILKKIKSFGKFNENKAYSSPSVISVFISFLLFWWPLTKKIIVEIKYIYFTIGNNSIK